MLSVEVMDGALSVTTHWILKSEVEKHIYMTSLDAQSTFIFELAN